MFTLVIEQRLCPKGWVHPCLGIKRQPDAKERVRFLDVAERTCLYAAVKASEYPPLYALTLLGPENRCAPWRAAGAHMA